MRFKNNKIWMALDPEGKPLSKNGKVLIKYQINQDYEYWVHEKNIKSLNNIIDEPNDGAHIEQGKKKAVPSKTKKAGRTADGSKNKIKETIPENAICVFTDGASSGNPGPSGIGVFLRYGPNEKEISRNIGIATNNIAELEAIRVALKELKQKDLPVRLFTDSSYAFGVLTLGWKPKKNQKLIRSILRLIKTFKDIKFIKVKGHSGHPENEIADRLATSAIKKL